MRSLTSGGGSLEEPREATVALSRLIRRETFYKEKALRIEKDLIFAKEQIEALEARIHDLTKKEREQIEAEREALQTQIKELNQRLEEETVLFKERENDLLAEIEKLKQRSVQSETSSSYKEKIAAYERLLTEIQATINEKEREVIIYKARLESAERRLRQQNAFAELENKAFVNERPSDHNQGAFAISYIEHALILSEENCLIRGECVIENVGTEKLDTPLICFRINPLDVVHLKGKIQDERTDEEALVHGMDLTWSLIQSDWATQAKERDELWLMPNRPIALEPGEALRVPDLQFMIHRKYCERVTIEGFIYFKKSNYKIKMVNPIIINF